MSKILVTGSAGFIAFHWIEHLLRAGHSVVGIDSLDDGYARAVKERNLADLTRIALESGASFRSIEADLLSIDFSTLPQDFDLVVHLAARAGIRRSVINPIETMLSNVVTTTRLLDWVKSTGIKKIICASSSSVYGEKNHPPFRENMPTTSPISPYASSKVAAELICTNFAEIHELKIISLRFFTVYGPRQRPDLAIRHFSEHIVEGQPIRLFGDTQRTRDYTFVGDIVRGIQAAWERGFPRLKEGTHEVYNLGSGRPISLDDTVRELERAIGKKAVIEHVEMQEGDMLHTHADLTKVCSELGYEPTTSFQAGIESFISWLGVRRPYSTFREIMRRQVFKAHRRTGRPVLKATSTKSAAFRTPPAS